VLRAYLEYARQVGLAARGSTARDTLLRHPQAARALVQLFRARFDPELGAAGPEASAYSSRRRTALTQAARALSEARDAITSAVEDRVFAALENLIDSSLRASFFAPAPPGPHELALKLDSRQIRGLAPPVPWVEMFVHSRELVGVHLRGGPIARGGLRWSDRAQDLRSEVLALWRTQMVKNGLIVPVGAKGGFALRRDPSDAKTARAEADRLYARFVAALLRLTDGVRAGVTVAPEGVVRHDGDDPYLVVAADKGTAHLSDTANAAASAAGFWLGDAFASGGSNGYDHKREAITARGAWLCVRRHFLELGRDPQSESFSAVGIGDMSGDVFGNGLLLMPRVKLVAAFDHRHVFVDPNPDPERAFAERARLFALPRSSWADYAREALSSGGGVFERSAKRITPSAEARRALGLEQTHVSGEELVRAVLCAPVDLLWNGGIGTYVKATSESHEDAGDRANDGVRIDARELRARVIGEGGNVGLTQLARIEYALAGGRIDTDAIDNAGGVALSDHEVNFKILLAARAADGSLSADERSAALRDCVEDADLSVLGMVASQARALSLESLRAASDRERLRLAADFLVAHAELDPGVERLPTREAIRTRGWARPELAVLLGYSKRMAKRELAAAPEVTRHPLIAALFRAYFPASLAERFAGELDSHPLRDAIAATCLASRVLDRAGSSYLPELTRTLARPVPDLLAAWLGADRALGAESLRAELAAAPIAEDERLRRIVSLEEAVANAAALSLALDGRPLGSEAEEQRRGERIAELRELSLARGAEAMPQLVRALGALRVAERSGAPLARAVESYLELGARTRIHWLLERLDKVAADDGWTRAASAALGLELTRTLCELCERELSPNGAARPRAELEPWLRAIDEVASEIEPSSRSLAPLLVVSQRIRRLC
jgi:glutamate dehydrogenase